MFRATAYGDDVDRPLLKSDGNYTYFASDIAYHKNKFDRGFTNLVDVWGADHGGYIKRVEAAIKAVEAVDGCLGEIRKALQPRGGAWIVTADHGNAETMIDPVTGGPHTYHTTNPVPLILATENEIGPLAQGGSLRDVAPTLLGILGMPVPPEMTGHDLRMSKKG